MTEYREVERKMTRKVRIHMLIAGAVLTLLGVLAVWGGIESLGTAPVTTKVCRCLDTENGRVESDQPCPSISDPLIHETVCREVRHGGPQPAIVLVGTFFLVLAIAMTRLGLLVPDPGQNLLALLVSEACLGPTSL